MRAPFPALLILAVAAPALAAEAPRTLTLDEALETAREHQPQIRQAQASTGAAEARVDEARASLLPQVSGSASYQRSTANSVTRVGSFVNPSRGSSWTTYPYTSFGLSASELLYDFGATSSRLGAAKASAVGQRDSERGTLQQVLYAVRTAYFQSRAAKGLVTVAKDTLANQEKHLSQTEGFVDVGTQPEIALAQARTDRANAQVQLINAENGYETAKAVLNQAMGLDTPADYDVADETLPPVDNEGGTTDELFAEALHARPEVAAADAVVHADEMTARAIARTYWPTLDVTSSFTDSGEHLDSLGWNWGAVLNLTVPIFQGGATRAQVREAQWNLTGAKAQADAIRQQVRLEVEQARLAVRAAKSALGAAGEALINAQEQLRLAEGRYETGVGNVIELGDAQVALTAAGQQKVQADYNLAAARAQLINALGRP